MKSSKVLFGLAIAGVLGSVACGADTNPKAANGSDAGDAGGLGAGGGGGAGKPSTHKPGTKPSTKDAGMPNSDAAIDSGTGMDAGLPPKVDFKIPKKGGSVTVMGPGDTQIDFHFPANAAGTMVTLTPISAAEIGWPADQFAQVIRMEPDGTKFAEPVVIRPSTGDGIVLDSPSSSSQSTPEGLPLNEAGDGFLLS